MATKSSSDSFRRLLPRTSVHTRRSVSAYSAAAVTFAITSPRQVFMPARPPHARDRDHTLIDWGCGTVRIHGMRSGAGPLAALAAFGTLTFVDQSASRLAREQQRRGALELGEEASPCYAQASQRRRHP